MVEKVQIANKDAKWKSEEGKHRAWGRCANSSLGVDLPSVMLRHQELRYGNKK